MNSVRLIQDDCIAAMTRMIGAGVQFDAAITDPPYHLESITKRFGKTGSAAAKFGKDGRFSRSSGGFMGAKWDGTEDDGRRIAFEVETWSLVHALLKPGAYLFAFASPKNGHRMACAIEDAGFIMHPFIGWAYGQGFPKAHAINDPAWEGWYHSTQSRKPALEPIYMAQKPFDQKTGLKNVQVHGVGAVNIDGCRVGTRWPANLCHDGSDAVMAQFPDAPGQIAASVNDPDRRKTQNVYGAMSRGGDGSKPRGDSGSAARFFGRFPYSDDEIDLIYRAKATKADRAGSKHPTVKPVSLMQDLARFITPPGGHILDPFAGSGTTGAAALAEGMRATLIEREDEYAADIRRRFGLEHEAA